MKAGAIGATSFQLGRNWWKSDSLHLAHAWLLNVFGFNKDLSIDVRSLARAFDVLPSFVQRPSWQAVCICITNWSPPHWQHDLLYANVVERQGKASFTFASIMLLRSASSTSSQSSSLSSSCPLAVIYQCHLRLHLPPLRHHHRSRMKHATHREIDWKRDATR